MTRKDRPPSLTKSQRYDVAIEYGAIILCQGCGFAIYVDEMNVDHHQAWIDDGEHVLENWRPLCFGCNSRKGVVEHKNNSKAKRVFKERTLHLAILKGEAVRPPGKIRNGKRQFPKRTFAEVRRG